MAKKKNSMALFEVISNSRDKNPDSEVLVPNWVRPGHQDQQDQQAPEVPEAQAPATPEPISPEPEIETPAQDEKAVSEPPPPSAPPSAPVLPTTSTWEPRPASDTSKTSDPPICSTDGGRLTLSLNYVSCLVASMGILVLIGGAFVLGRMTASPEALLPQPQKKIVKREAGKFYMVIQTLDGNTTAAMAEANRIVKFCNANGEPAQVQLLPNIVVVDGKKVRGKGNLIVWSATPFKSEKNEEVRAHALFIQNELGVKYARKYGSKYKFTQPQKSGKLNPLMFPYNPPKKRP